VSRTFDRNRELPLVFGTGSGDSTRDDSALLRNAAGEALFVFVIDVDVFRVAEPACPFLALLLVPAAGTACEFAPPFGF